LMWVPCQSRSIAWYGALVWNAATVGRRIRLMIVTTTGSHLQYAGLVTRQATRLRGGIVVVLANGEAVRRRPWSTILNFTVQLVRIDRQSNACRQCYDKAKDLADSDSRVYVASAPKIDKPRLGSGINLSILVVRIFGDRIDKVAHVARSLIVAVTARRIALCRFVVESRAKRIRHDGACGNFLIRHERKGLLAIAREAL